MSLHKFIFSLIDFIIFNVYIVKYRLSKTRSEPVVYIFQVDVARNKLTGALNNITLDLVGKIK